MSVNEPYQLKVNLLMSKNGYIEGKNWITKKFVGEDHNENFWRNRFHHPLQFFFSKQEIIK